jgi:hypothetical protein
MIPNERPTPLTDAVLLNICGHTDIVEICGHTDIVEADFARTLERSLAERTEERDEARAICKIGESMAVHTITCIHHTDVERAALPVHGNCPVCAKRLLDTALAKLAKCREALDRVKQEHEHFGYGFEDCRDKVIKTLEETK